MTKKSNVCSMLFKNRTQIDQTLKGQVKGTRLRKAKKKKEWANKIKRNQVLKIRTTKNLKLRSKTE